MTGCARRRESSAGSTHTTQLKHLLPYLRGCSKVRTQSLFAERATSMIPHSVLRSDDAVIESDTQAQITKLAPYAKLSVSSAPRTR